MQSEPVGYGWGIKRILIGYRKEQARNRLFDWATGDEWNSYDSNPSIQTFHNYRNELLGT